MLVPGRVFMPENELSGAASPYLRASYSIAPVEKFDVAMSRLAEIIREEQEATKGRNVGDKYSDLSRTMAAH